MSNLQTLIFYATPEHACSYLPDKKATTMFVDPKANINLDIYSQLSGLGFRRSGNHYYRPHCNACKACVPLRVQARRYKPSRSQKRIQNKNKDLEHRVMAADFHEDHYLLYEKYIQTRHADGDMYPPSRGQYRSFLAESHSSTRFIEFSKGGKLYAVAVVDFLIDGLSAIYTFFDPEFEHLSLGTYAILWQIAEAKRQNLPYLYLGYFIGQSKKMNYKSSFKPFEARINDCWLDEEYLLSIAQQHSAE